MLTEVALGPFQAIQEKAQRKPCSEFTKPRQAQYFIFLMEMFLTKLCSLPLLHVNQRDSQWDHNSFFVYKCYTHKLHRKNMIKNAKASSWEKRVLALKLALQPKFSFCYAYAIWKTL